MTNTQNIKQALDRAATIVSTKPEIGQRTYTAVARLDGGLYCRITEKQHEIIADLPQSMGGENAGPTPSTLLRAAMASCTAMGVRMWSAREQLTVSDVEVRFETDVDARGQFGVSDNIVPGFEAARLKISVRTPDDAEAVEAAVHKALRFSPLMDAVSSKRRIDVEIAVTAETVGASA